MPDPDPYDNPPDRSQLAFRVRAHDPAKQHMADAMANCLPPLAATNARLLQRYVEENRRAERGRRYWQGAPS